MASKRQTTNKRTSRSALQQLVRELIRLPDRSLRLRIEMCVISSPAAAPIRKHAPQMQYVLDGRHAISAQLIHQQRNSRKVLHRFLAFARLPVVPELYV